MTSTGRGGGPKRLGVLNPTTNDRMEVPTIMRGLDPEVGDVIWAGIEPLLPRHVDSHPLGCHRPRASDRACFEVMLLRLALGCSWEDAERLTGKVVSDTTVRARRDEWIRAGVFDAIATEAIRSYDKIVELDLSDVAIDGSIHKAPGGGGGTGKSGVDRGKRGWKWSIATDAKGIPLGWSSAEAAAHDSRLFAPTIDHVAQRGLLVDIETLWLDRGYDANWIREYCARLGLDDVIAPRRRGRKRARRGKKVKTPLALGLRWPVERTNSWLSNYGQLRRNTDRSIVHRMAQLALAVTCLIVAKLIDWRNRWSPDSVPIR
jgi:transposase